MSYKELLQAPQWLYFRDRVLLRDCYRCVKCFSQRRLQIHHLYYLPGAKPWDYPFSAVVTLCEECHKAVHNIAMSETSLTAN